MTRTTAWREDARLMRARAIQGAVSPASFRAALLQVTGRERDAWLDAVLGLEELPDDGLELPPGCVPYLPCPVDALLRTVDAAQISAADVVVDLGSGVGRSAALIHLVTGAATIGIEIQSALVTAARALAKTLRLSRCTSIHGDANELVGDLPTGTVFFLYCPFSGARLSRVLDDLEDMARTRRIRVCTVDLPLPDRDWLAPVTTRDAQVTVHESRVGASPREAVDR